MKNYKASSNQLIRKMDLPDIREVVLVHIHAFQGFFLTFLGSNFLNELYTGIILDKSGIGYVILDENKIIGFVCGSTQSNGLYSRLLMKRWWHFGWAAIPRLLKKPDIIPRLLRALKMPKMELPVPNCATLMSIAIEPAKHGRGGGKLLVEAFQEEAKRRGCDYINLTTDAIGNERVNSFYQNLGFTFFKSYHTPEGRKMNFYIKQII